MGDKPHQTQPEGSSFGSVTATSKVFATPELFEMILVDQPALDVLMCQRVNRTWRDIIAKSNTLQWKLFYRCDLVKGDEEDPSPGEELLRLETNPFIQLLHRREAIARQNNRVHDHRIGRLDYAEASWKKMYLTRPALCTIETCKKIPESSDGSPESEFLVQIIQHDTIKMSHLRETYPAMHEFLTFSQSDGIRMHHLQKMDLSRLRLANSGYCIRCIGALASNKEKRVETPYLANQIRRLHMFLNGFPETFFQTAP